MSTHSRLRSCLGLKFAAGSTAFRYCSVGVTTRDPSVNGKIARVPPLWHGLPDYGHGQDGHAIGRGWSRRGGTRYNIQTETFPRLWRFKKKKASGKSNGQRAESTWRRERDSNPRAPFGANGFQDRRFQPLTHPSAAGNIPQIGQVQAGKYQPIIFCYHTPRTCIR